ncbi:hypothetical protein IT402_00495 [Candidatus Nomurabacteria bacterium]|nr:hypothetical protein [Candidatus Nomurabacteria bacterium]
MKNSKYILLAVAVVIVILAGLTKDKKEVVNEQEPKNEVCYIWNTEAGDSASLRMSFEENGNVSGTFNFEPYQKDAKKGAFDGVVMILEGESLPTAQLLWQANGEGVINTEELYVKFSDGIASPGFGEMKDRGDGVYVYASPENISYPINLQQTDCQ